jgi:hypothetical protein
VASCYLDGKFRIADHSTGARFEGDDLQQYPRSRLMSDADWRTEFKRLWKELVPPEGQANTVQGELIRAVGKLKDEAFRNGNQNFGKRITEFSVSTFAKR